MNRSPIGCCALAGTTYPTDREMEAVALGFDGICRNSLDGVSDRDFGVELLSDLSILMRRFHQQNGNVLITFYRCSSDTLAAGLMHQKYDIIFTWDSTNLKTQAGVSYRTVEKAGLVVAMYAGHPLAQRRQLRRQELRGENILYMSPDAADDSYGDALFMHLYQAAGYKPNILFRSADTESILMMVAAEEGISILPDYCTDKLYHADNLVFVPLTGPGEEEEIIAAWQSGNANPALGRFLTVLEGGL